MLKTDVVVLGGGPGGLAAADLLAMRGRSVVVVNDGALMGYGIRGAFSSKAAFEIVRQYVYASFREDVFGKVRPPRLDRVLRDNREAADELTANVAARLARQNVRIVQGKGSFVDPHTVRTDEQTVTADHVIVATGTSPRNLPGVAPVDGRILTSDTVLSLRRQPESMLVVGGGVIGCEFAGLFAALGTRVTMLDSQSRILAMEDPDVSEFVAGAFRRFGVDVRGSARLAELTATERGVRAVLQSGEALDFETALLAVGREPNQRGLGLETAGVETDARGYIPVDANMRTNVPHIYAVGDIGQRNTLLDIALVHVAQAEGRLAAHHIIDERFDNDMRHIPYIVFTIPMLAGAGLSETAARESYGDGVRVGKYPLTRNHRAHAISPPLGFVKLIVGPPGQDDILGVRVVGRDADSLVAAASIMIERGLPYQYLLDAILPHPSLMEALQGAAQIIAGEAPDIGPEEALQL